MSVAPATVTLRRGKARPSDLSDALNALGIGAGDDFVITRAPADTEHDRNELGAFPGNGDGADTARQAALDNYPRSGKQRHQVLIAVARAGAQGTTTDAIAEEYGMRLYSVKPRMLELRRGGWVERTGKQRPSHTGSGVDVHVLTPKGADAVREHDPDVSARWAPPR